MEMVFVKITEGREGVKMHLALKEKKIKTPVMVLTNLSQAEDENRVKALGAKEFFVKSNTTIATTVEKVTEFLK